MNKKPSLNLRKIKGIVLDIDGTLLRGNAPMPGLIDFFDFLHQHNIVFKVASNNSTKTTAQYQQKLAQSGAPIAVENVLTSAVATGAYLKRQYPQGGSAFIIGKPSLRQAVREAGFEIFEDAAHTVDVVIAGGDDELTYTKLKFATLLLQKGAHFIGTNPDVVYPTEEGLVPETGTTLAALRAASGVQPVIIGKPQPFLFNIAIQNMGTAHAETAILGDRLETDILGGQQAGLRTILITTGIDNENTVPLKKIYPDLIVQDLNELTLRWQTALETA